MSRFEQVGVALQEQADSEWEARRAFAFSCRKCTAMGGCHRCAIKAAHEARLENIKILALVREELASRK
jgi:hypothetical protein